MTTNRTEAKNFSQKRLCLLLCFYNDVFCIKIICKKAGINHSKKNPGIYTMPGFFWEHQHFTTASTKIQKHHLLHH